MKIISDPERCQDLVRGSVVATADFFLNEPKIRFKTEDDELVVIRFGGPIVAARVYEPDDDFGAIPEDDSDAL